MELNDKQVDVVIIGAGPSGLAAGMNCLFGGVSFLILESGNKYNDRSRHIATQAISGVGGAGLFSDGKLSFSPAGHMFWNLHDKQTLKKCFEWLKSITSDFFEEFPEFIEQIRNISNQNEASGNFYRKEYFSKIISQENLFKLAERMTKPIESRILSRSTAKSIELKNDIFQINYIDKIGTCKKILSRGIICCPGRFGCKSIRYNFSLKKNFLRFEYGVRIRQKSRDFFLNDFKETDPKLIIASQDSFMEWRTFCCCRNGDIIKADIDGKIAFSGTTSDVSDFSNVGFNCRIFDGEFSKTVADEFSRLLSIGSTQFSVPLSSFLNEPEKRLYFGKKLDHHLRQGLRELSNRYDIQSAEVIGPCIEGIGEYPVLNQHLETSIKRFYICGDFSGIFRGLVPALLSGIYASTNLCKELMGAQSVDYSNIKFKRSSTEGKPVIFTAQSKKFFYCRDAICEFVFKHGGIPLNPFRIFDFFLNDRVERDLVRQGNNQLVKTSDELWIFGPIADGVLFEFIHASIENKPIRFFTIGTQCSDIRQIVSIDEIKFEPEVHSSQQTRQQLLYIIDQYINGSSDSSIKLERQLKLFEEYQ